MNSKTLIPVATALVGFALGWGVKPGPTEGNVSDLGKDGTKRTASGTIGSSEPGRSVRPSRPLNPKNSVAPLAPSQDAVAVQQRLENAFHDAISLRDRAKLIRISEALGLSTEQLDQFDALLAEQRQQPAESTAGLSPKARLEKMTQSAKAFDAKFRALLGPEQTAALDTLRARQAANRIESKAQRELADFIDRVDVSPEQREAVTEVLRASAAKDAANLPAGVELLMESGYLPSGLGSISDRSIESMMAIGDDAPSAMDPRATALKMADLQRERILTQAKALEGILTPAQLAQYRAVAEAQGAIQGGLPKP